MPKWIAGYLVFISLWVYALTQTMQMFNVQSDIIPIIGTITMIILCLVLYYAIRFFNKRICSIYKNNKTTTSERQGE